MIKIDSKDFYIVIKNIIFWLFKINIILNNNNNKKSFWDIDRKKKMISEGSCDHVTGIMAAENSALHQRNQLNFKTLKYKTAILNCNNISIILLFYCIFDQINAASVRRFLSKT